MSTPRKHDPIHKVELADGRTRYRFVVDVGIKANGKRDQRTFTFDKLGEARKERARIIAETDKGTYVKPAKTTVDEWLAEWLDLKSAKKASTWRHYVDVLRPVRDRYGALPLQQLTERQIEVLKADMASGAARRRGRAGEPLSPRSINATLTALSMALAEALRRQLVARNVADNVSRVESDPDAGADRGEWQAADAVAFLDSVRAERLFAAFFLSMLGLRRGEVLGLRWEHVDLTGAKAAERKLPPGTPSIAVVNNRVATLDAKGKTLIVETTPKGKGRRRAPYLPIPKVLVTALKTLHKTQSAEKLAAGEAYGSCPQCGGAHVVVGEDGLPPRPQLYSDRFMSLAKAAGLVRVPLHGSRHVAASLLADLGVPDVAAAAWLGHTKVEVTRGYQHVFGDQLAATSTALGKALDGGASA